MDTTQKDGKQYLQVAHSDEKQHLTQASASPMKHDGASSSGLAKVGKVAKGFVPIADWLPNYKWKDWISGDLISGLTVGIMHVPQGMAYAALAAVPPINGLYSSFFASTFYMFFGTSRHVSIGCFAVASMMVGALMMDTFPDGDTATNSTLRYKGASPLEVTSAVTLTVGLSQLVMALCRLGFITAYLSDPLIAGFTTGSAVHVFMSQLNKVFGIAMPRHSGVGMIIFMMRDIILSLGKTNWMAFGISVFGIVFLSLGRDYLNPLVKKRCPVPVPLELILVIIGTTFSVVMNLRDDWHIKVVNHIPRGFPTPAVPRASLIVELLPKAVPLAVVCYIFIISMAKLFAKKHKYRIDSSQEMFACSFFSLLSSFFPVYPVGASLSRSAVCEMSGAKTLLYTVFSSTLLLTVILFLGPLLEPLPMCILACIVMVSLKSLFLQVKDLPRLWKISKYDFAIWLVACLATVLINVTEGLVIAVAFAILTVVLREQWPSFSKPDVKKQCEVIPSEEVRVMKYEAPLHFANTTRFLDELNEAITSAAVEGTSCIVVDCSAIAYIDSMGVDALKEAYSDASRAGVILRFAAFNDSISAMFAAIDMASSIPEKAFYDNLGDALCPVSKDV